MAVVQWSGVGCRDGARGAGVTLHMQFAAILHAYCVRWEERVERVQEHLRSWGVWQTESEHTNEHFDIQFCYYEDASGGAGGGGGSRRDSRDAGANIDFHLKHIDITLSKSRLGMGALKRKKMADYAFKLYTVETNNKTDIFEWKMEIKRNQMKSSNEIKLIQWLFLFFFRTETIMKDELFFSTWCFDLFFKMEEVAAFLVR